MTQTESADHIPRKTCCLGLLAGLGVGAAIHYYRHLVLSAEAHGRALDMVMAHARTTRVFEYIEAADRDGLAAYLNGFIVRLQAAGAEFAVLPAVTPHYCIRELAAISPLPLVNIFEPLVQEIGARNIRRVSVFGSEPVMKSGLYGQLGDVEVVSHRPEELRYLRDTYQALLDTGTATVEQHAGLTALAHAIIDRDGVDAIVLAGTDLAIIFQEENTHFPFLDCAALHIEAITGILLSRSIPPA